MGSLEILVVLAMVFVNAIFAAYEIALASISVSRLNVLINEHRRGARSALEMKEGIERSLAVVQLGITLVGLIAGATGGASAGDQLAPVFQHMGLGPRTANVLAIAVVVVPLTALTIVIGELVPKLFALRNKEFICLQLSPPMRGFANAVWPVVWLLEASASGLMDLSERFWRPRSHSGSRAEAAELQELRAITSLARTSRLIGAREENIILGAARLSSRKLSEIMLPAEHISMLSLNDSISSSLLAAHMDMHTRFPVAEKPGDPQTIIGYVTFKDIIAVLKNNPSEPSIRSIIRGIPSLYDDLPIATALEQLMREHTHIALVRDHAQKVLGMITLEDIVEELIGDVQDEYDLLPVHVVKAGNGWLVGGGLSPLRFRDLTGVELQPLHPDEPTQPHNLAAWIAERIGRIPRGGEEVLYQGFRIIVRKVRRQRVLEASITPVEKPAAALA
ncbi:MAG: hemolysin family protein [Aureliella sp.]